MNRTLTVAQPQDMGLDAKQLEVAFRLLKDWTEGPTPPIPGGAIVAGRQGKMIEPRFFGKQGPEENAEAIRQDGMFLMASITKPIVYLAGLMMVERGLLNLSDHVTRYIPEFAAHHKEDTLVIHLFTHTSGMPDMLLNNQELRKQHAPLEKFIDGAIRDTVPLFQPGKRLSYQSMGTLVVAEIVQRLSKKPIAQFLKDEIFEPLGLKSIGLGSKGFAANRLVRVQTPDYQRDSDFGWNSDYWREFGAPWGGMFSSPADFAVICQMLLNQGVYGNTRLLSPMTVQRATTNRLHDLPDLPESIRRTQPWGLGWQLNHGGLSGSWGDSLGPGVFGHTGATGTLVWMDPERDGFCLLLTTAIRSKAPWRLVHLSNAISAAFV